MFKQGKYIALILFMAFAFKLVFLSLSVIGPLVQYSSVAGAQKESNKEKTERVCFDNKAPYDTQTEVSEEADEDDSNESLEKVYKYPVLLCLSGQHVFKYAAAFELHTFGLTLNVNPTSKTYIDLSVLRI